MWYYVAINSFVWQFYFQIGNFTLSVMFHSYLNNERLCGECHLLNCTLQPICCDTINNKDQNCYRPFYFRYVLSVEAYKEPLRHVSLPACRPDFRSDNITMFPVGPNAFIKSRISNPVSLQLHTWTVSIIIHKHCFCIFGFHPNSWPNCSVYYRKLMPSCFPFSFHSNDCLKLF